MVVAMCRTETMTGQTVVVELKSPLPGAQVRNWTQFGLGFR